MAGTIQCDYLQPTSSAGLTILTPSGNTVASINTSGVFSTTGSLMLSANGTIVTSTYATLTANTVQIGQSGSSSNNFTLYQPSTPDGTVRLGNGNAGSVTDLVTLTSTGNMGIGTSSPGAKLSVVGGDIKTDSASRWIGYWETDTIHDGYLIPYDAQGFTNIVNSYVSAGILFKTGNAKTERMRLDSSGNLGLGVTPSAWTSFVGLQIGGLGGASIAGASNDTFHAMNAYYSGGWKFAATGVQATMFRQNGGAHYWYNSSNTTGTAGATWTPNAAMTLDASGNWSVGHTGIGLANLNSIQYSVSNAQGYITHVNGTVSGQGYWIFGYNGSTIGTIVQNGTTGVTYNTSSDQRLKENIVDAPNALDSVNAIKVRSFDWKSDGSHVDYGFIAQEALEVAPEVVSVPSDPDEMMGVDYGKITPRLIKAFQEMYEELQSVKSELAELKSRG